ncbi:BREX-2 system adenine-specific DNA-methyltransferase PglX [Pseudonocardia lacus]|uniref:BREX-2 system adenine-specific DNA-methyltransferase PglX n=1 Tax=Pseudonocardia lacus TaxID=2835865 RepID=UPI001BDBCB24|nr:BREX-2 system adenine-specific DNA-methyltransferase PglX [Pseudonocardia lacus]
MAVVDAGVRQQLVKDLRAQVTVLEKDLLARAKDVPEFAERLKTEYDAARDAERTAAGFTEWREGRITQAAAAWVLSTVFVRYCEDNGLIEWPFLAGPDDRLADAEERHEQFFSEHPTLNDRDWLIAAFEHLSAAHPTAAGLFDRRHNPLWELTPSFEAATALIAFWRRRDDTGAIRYSFADWDTRFLGDLYQDLSEAARKTYALLQTPEFVEEFILDLTLEPAVEEFGLAGLRTIDPASGSGHFLLGLFHRILAKWRAAEPGTDDWTLIRRAMESVHGCDKNPFATSVARFRLLVAALNEAGELRLDRAREFPINVAVGDSLIHGRGASGIQQELDEPEEPHIYSTEDVNDFVRSCDLLGRASYQVVVGNPPYITVKDRLENYAYRDRYGSCSGKYALSVPFAERLFQLAVRTSGSDRTAGFVGQITANSFMKREFGKKLIEWFNLNVHLTHIIDTSGAYIPAHGTPTVILIGRNHIGRLVEPIRTVLGVQGEPSEPAEPANGLVWTAITRHLGLPGSESEWVSVEDSQRTKYATHPWSVSGGGASDVFDLIMGENPPLGLRTHRIGVFGMTNADDVMLAPTSAWTRRVGSDHLVRKLLLGDELRNWRADGSTSAFFPYDAGMMLASLAGHDRLLHWMWPCRTTMGNRATFSKLTYIQEGRPWYEWHQVAVDPGGHQFTIAYGEVSTHNHFVLVRGEEIFKQTAPVIKLPATASEPDHLALLGLLNSSTACFWLKEVCHCKGSTVDSRGARQSTVPWEDFYQFNGTNVGRFPLPCNLPFDLGRELDHLARLLAVHEPDAVCDRATPTRDNLAAARAEHEQLRRRMIALQEELDWQVYGSYGLITETESKGLLADSWVEPLALGERAFEIVLARKVAAGEVETAWFDRHGSTPITEIPSHWSPEYQKVVQARIDLIENRRDIALIERPECKRRWAAPTWEKKEGEALRTWLLDRCEQPDLWFAPRDGMRQPRPLTVSQLADRLSEDADVVSVAQLYATDHLGKRDLPLAKVLESVVADEHVPFLAALRYKDPGLVKRAEWERTWELQREEDRTGKNLQIPVPPKYKPTDFRKPSYWAQRGKLDVPKERFVSYPGASPDADPTLLLGWAGWDHKDQAQALVNLVNDRASQAGWDTDRLTPLLAGLDELLPWVHQWHGEYDAEWDGIPAEEYQAYLDEQRTKRELSLDALRAWKPAAATRGRRPKATT